MLIMFKKNTASINFHFLHSHDDDDGDDDDDEILLVLIFPVLRFHKQSSQSLNGNFAPRVHVSFL